MPDDKPDPLSQINWMTNYIRGRYAARGADGTPDGDRAFGWYGKGGALPQPDDDASAPEDVEVTCAGGITIPPLGAGDGPPGAREFNSSI